MTLLSRGLSLFGDVVFAMYIFQQAADTLTIIDPAFVGEIYLKYTLVAFVSRVNIIKPMAVRFFYS